MKNIITYTLLVLSSFLMYYLISSFVVFEFPIDFSTWKYGDRFFWILMALVIISAVISFYEINKTNANTE